MSNINFKIQKSAINDIYSHLLDVDGDIIPRLSVSVNLKKFGEKIFYNTIRFEAWYENKLIGLISVYYNNFDTAVGFINHVGVAKDYRGLGVSDTLLINAIKYGIEKNFEGLKLEVSMDAIAAKKLYEKHGFKGREMNGNSIQMYRKLKDENIV